MIIQVNCNYKAHVPQLLIVPGKIIIESNNSILKFKAYSKNYTPFNLTFERHKVVRYKQTKGVLGDKFLIYYQDYEWYKFTNISKSDFKLT